MKAILLDIEGTTTPIDFVHKTLFPFSRERMAKFVEANFSVVHDEINKLVEESAGDSTYTVPVDPTEPGSIAKYLEHLIDVDRKSTALKSIQGQIWKSGYESGALLSQVFDDVPHAFGRWKSDGKTIAIFSSGSVLAQQLLFRYTNAGDLTPFIDAYFDTTVGNKRDAESYRKIAAELSGDRGEVVFVSDVIDELDAAAAGGLEAVLAVRPGNPNVDREHSFKTIRTFDGLG